MSMAHKILNLKEFTLFCREFENVVNRAFWGEKLVGANCYAFCDYGADQLTDKGVPRDPRGPKCKYQMETHN